VIRALVATLLAAAPAFAQAPERVVVAGGDLAEIAHALGAGDRLVGVDTTSLYPPELAELPQIGYVRALAPEGVLSLSPDLLIGAHDAGPASALDKLRAAGLVVEIAPAAQGAGSVPAKIDFVGGLLGLETEAAALAEVYRAEMARLQEIIAGVSDRPRVLFILALRDGAPLVAGADTAAQAMIELAGARNAATGFTGYQAMNREAVLAAAPDVVLMMEGRDHGAGGPDAVLALPEIAPTPAGQAGRLVTMDGLLLLGFGPRTPDAVRQLAAALHPGDRERLGL
jgi:iron complex transport system substrate-binding protein